MNNDKYEKDNVNLNYSADVNEEFVKEVENQPAQKIVEPIIKRRKKFLKFAICAMLYLVGTHIYSLLPHFQSENISINDGGAQPCPDDYSESDYSESVDDEENLLP